MSAGRRIRLSLARYGIVVAVVLALLAAAAIAGAVVTYTNPPVEEVTERTNQQAVATDVQSSARVVNDTELYSTGQVLRDQPAYFYDATPNLTLGVRTTVPADQSVEVSQRLSLRITGARDGEPFYQSRRVLIARQTATDSGSVRTNATVNMSALRRSVERTRAAIGAVGTLQVSMRLTVTYETDRYAGALNASSPVALAEEAYWLDGELAASRTHSESETRRVTQSPDMTTVGLLGLLGIVLLAVAVVVRRESRDIDYTSLRTELEHTRYEEWISSGEIPTKSENDYVRTESLEDLVDVAIDSNRRVIHDQDLNVYAVVQGNFVYYFTPRETDLTDWFDV